MSSTSVLQLSENQLTDLSEIRTLCLAKGDAVGAWQEFYAYLLKAILKQAGLPSSAPDSYLHAEILAAKQQLPSDQFQAAVWLLGAIDVNSGIGPFSKIIREYNKHQGELRGYIFSDLDLQRSSNKVGSNMADQIFGNQDDPGLLAIPKVQQIGEYDLNGVRDILFPGNKQPGSEFYLNQTWPGIIMLGIQGGQFTDRLIRPNNTNSEDVFVDTLQDFQNMVLSWESFRYSFYKTQNDIFSDWTGEQPYIHNTVAIALGIFDAENLASAAHLTPEAWFRKLIANQNPIAATALGKIVDWGTLSVIDFLRGARQGSPVSRKTTQVSLMDDCLTLFSAIDHENPTGIKASFMPTNAADIVSLVQTDMSARAALMALSPIKTDISASVAEQMQNSSWFDNTTAGRMWVADRAAMLVAQFPTEYQAVVAYTDELGQISAGVPKFAAGIHVTFNAKASSGDSGLDRLYGTDGADVLSGKGGADELYGGDGNDWLGYDTQGLGGESLDEIEGAGNVYAGGKDNDVIAGSKSKDTYFFSKGDGVDFIATNGGSDDLILDSLSIKEDTVSFVRDQLDLLVVIPSTGPNVIADKVRIRNWFDPSTSSNQLGRVVLGEKIWTAAEITRNVLAQHGTAGADQMTGLAGYKTTFFAGAGDDIILGGSGESRSDLGDTFEGGLGNDDITGTLSSDTYLYAMGDGQDVIRENGGVLDNLVLSNIDINNAVFYSLGNDLIASFGSSTDSITIKNWYVGDSHKIESWTFSNGATITGADVEQRAGKGVIGTADSDFVITDWSSFTDEVLIGREGDDNIYTGWGKKSTILFYKGDGTDTIDFMGDTTVQTGVGLGADFSVIAMTRGAISIKWSSGEQLIINNIDGPWASASNSFTLRLNEGAMFTSTQLINLINNTTTNGADILHANSNAVDLYGSAGDDELWGSTQDQILNGGSNNDILRGNGGADYYIGGAGDDLIIANVANSGSTFVFGQGSDHDVVNLFNYQEGKIDTLRIVKGDGFDRSLTVEDLIFSKIEADSGLYGYYDLCVSIIDSNDSITIKDFINPNGRVHAIDRIVFDDGTQMSYDDIRIKLDADYDPTVIIGTGQDDYLPGNNLATKIYGKSGSDSIESSNIAELLDGGGDDDYIIAGTGDLVVGGLDSDTIVSSGDSISIKVGLNSGSDNIYLYTVSHTTLVWEGISAQDITARIEDANLIISANGDDVTFHQYFNGRFSQSDRNIENIRFDDGSILSNSSLLSLAGYEPYTIKGTNSSDYLEGDGIATKLVGFGGIDTIISSDGVEILEGGVDDDYIVAGSGDLVVGGLDSDTIVASGNSITIKVGLNSGSDNIYLNTVSHTTLGWEGISAQDITARIDGSNLIVSAKGDDVTFHQYFNGRFSQSDRNIESILFDDGSSLSNSSLLALAGYDPYAIRGTNSSDYLQGDGIATKLLGFGGADTISGYSAQHEFLFGGDQNDILTGGDGDTLIGGAGDDTYYQYVGEQTSIWSVGDGSDTIYAGPEDLLKFDNLSGVSSISASRNGNDLALAVNTGGGVTIKNYFTTTGGPKIELPNGKIWAADLVLSKFTPAVYGLNFPGGVVSASNFSSTILGLGWEFDKIFALYNTMGVANEFDNVWNSGLHNASFTGKYVNGHAVREYSTAYGIPDFNYPVGDPRYGIFGKFSYQFWENGSGGYDFSITKAQAGPGAYHYEYWDTYARINYSFTPTEYIVSPEITSFNLLDSLFNVAGAGIMPEAYEILTETPVTNLHGVVTKAVDDFSSLSSGLSDGASDVILGTGWLNLGQLFSAPIDQDAMANPLGGITGLSSLSESVFSYLTPNIESLFFKDSNPLSSNLREK